MPGSTRPTLGPPASHPVPSSLTAPQKLPGARLLPAHSCRPFEKQHLTEYLTGTDVSLPPSPPYLLGPLQCTHTLTDSPAHTPVSSSVLRVVLLKHGPGARGVFARCVHCTARGLPAHHHLFFSERSSNWIGPSTSMAPSTTLVLSTLGTACEGKSEGPREGKKDWAVCMCPCTVQPWHYAHDSENPRTAICICTALTSKPRGQWLKP